LYQDKAVVPMHVLAMNGMATGRHGDLCYLLVYAWWDTYLEMQQQRQRGNC
jgi:hypothetical protein